MKILSIFGEKKKVSSRTFLSHPAGLPERELFLWTAWKSIGDLTPPTPLGAYVLNARPLAESFPVVPSPVYSITEPWPLEPGVSLRNPDLSSHQTVQQASDHLPRYSARTYILCLLTVRMARQALSPTEV